MSQFEPLEVKFKFLLDLLEEELIQKAVSPARLIRHLQLGGDIEISNSDIAVSGTAA